MARQGKWDRLWLGQLLLSEQEGESNNDDNLTEQTNPEFPVSEGVVVSTLSDIPNTRVWECVSGSDLCWRGCSGDHDGCGTDELGEGEGGTDMQSG